MIRKFNNILSKWKCDASLNESILYDVDWDKGFITIYTTKPGYLIGYQGELVYRYMDIMKTEWFNFKEFKFKEVRSCVD